MNQQIHKHTHTHTPTPQLLDIIIILSRITSNHAIVLEFRFRPLMADLLFLRYNRVNDMNITEYFYVN